MYNFKLISYQNIEVHYKAGNWTIAGETKFTSWNNAKRKRNKIR